MILWPLWVLFAALVLIAWILVRIRLRRESYGKRPVVDDDAVRRIVEEGRLRTGEEEPLDLDEIRREERRFWDEERWDEAEGMDF